MADFSRTAQLLLSCRFLFLCSSSCVQAWSPLLSRRRNPGGAGGGILHAGERFPLHHWRVAVRRDAGVGDRPGFAHRHAAQNFASGLGSLAHARSGGRCRFGVGLGGNYCGRCPDLVGAASAHHCRDRAAVSAAAVYLLSHHEEIARAEYNFFMSDPLLRYRAEFPILEKTTYLISNSLGAMPRGVSDSLRQY